MCVVFVHLGTVMCDYALPHGIYVWLVLLGIVTTSPPNNEVALSAQLLEGSCWFANRPTIYSISIGHIHIIIIDGYKD